MMTDRDDFVDTVLADEEGLDDGGFIMTDEFDAESIALMKAMGI